MISIKHLSSLTAVSLLFVSCAPFPPGNGGRQAPIDPSRVPVAPRVVDTKAEAEAKAAAERKRIRDQKRRNAAAAAKAKESTSNTTSEPKVTPKPPVVNPPTQQPTAKKKYGTAAKIPGQEGYVYNPWTNKAVDVRGIPSGHLVRDPNDPNPDHKFRVP